MAYNGPDKLVEMYSVFHLESRGIKIDIEVEIIDIRFEELSDLSTDNALAGYSFFYKAYEACLKKGMSRQDAFETARTECIGSGYLRNYIEREAFILMYKDLDFINYESQLKTEAWEDGWDEGREEGRDEGLEKAILIAIRKKIPQPFIETLAEEAGITKERLDELMLAASEEVKKP